jgi:DNA-binding response OmpR family regulator
VFGIVRQAEGEVRLDSQLGRGTTFRILLPRVEEEPIPSARPLVRSPPGMASETLLVVEDDPDVRQVAVRVLQRAGYDVLAAGDPDEAKTLALGATTPIGLMLTDVVMPRGTGPELAAALARHQAGLRVLFMSGYEGIGERVALPPGACLLAKPFTPQVLLARVREVLDSKP